MLPASLSAVGLAAAAALLVAQQAAPAAPSAEELAAALARVQEACEQGKADRADKLLRELLERHAYEDHARRRCHEIVELARRSAFLRAAPTPKLADLVSGDVVRWDARTNDLELRYRFDRRDDFEREGEAIVHPAVFVDTLTVEIELGPRVMIGGEGALVMVGLGTAEQFAVFFGEHVGDHAHDVSYRPAYISRWREGGDAEVIEQENKPAPSYRRKGSLKVVVGSGGVTAYRDGKRILQAKRSTRESGQVGIQDIGLWERVTLKGRIQPTWPQALIDAATREAHAEFAAGWEPEEELPEWLFEATSAAAPGPSAASDEEFEARLAALAEQAGTWDRTTRIAVYERLVGELPGDADAWIGLVMSQLLAGDVAAAQASCDRALASGIDGEALDELPRMLAKARTGPGFARAFVHESANYVVKSDIDRETCAAAARMLEESYRSYRQRLAPVPGVERRKFQVFLFGGEAGYLDYAADVLGDEPDNTAGVYSPLLKQLLIWNLPDRAEMFATVRHEGFHQYLDRLVAEPPIWFNEGMAEYYELADLVGGEWKEGQVHAGHVALLRARPGDWLPLARFFALGYEEFYGERAPLHYAQAWLVVHHLRHGPKESRARFDALWAALLAGKPADEAMQAALPAVDVLRFELAVQEHLGKL